MSAYRAGTVRTGSPCKRNTYVPTFVLLISSTHVQVCTVEIQLVLSKTFSGKQCGMRGIITTKVCNRSNKNCCQQILFFPQEYHQLEQLRTRSRSGGAAVTVSDVKIKPGANVHALRLGAHVRCNKHAG